MTVDFTWDEWLQLTCMQRTLYRDVMLENYSHLVSVGYCISKPEVVFKLEQGEEPWPLERAFPCRSDPDRSQENQDKHLWRVSLINKKTLTKKRDNVFRKTPCQYDLHGMSLKNVSESVISDKNHSSKNSNEINACGKLLLDNNQENTHPGKKSDEHNQDGKSLSHNKDPTGQQKIQPLGPPVEGHECGAAVLSEAAIITPQRTQTEEKPQDYKEQGENTSDKSTLKVQQEIHTKENHSEVNECEKSTLFKHQEVNMEEETHESNENENNSSKKSHLTQLHKTHKGEHLNAVTARNLFTRNPTSLNIRKYTQERNHVKVINVGKPSRNHNPLTLREPTQERNPMNVIKPLESRPLLTSRGHSQKRSFMYVMNARNLFVIAQL
ncbi:zinc finger protein 33B isoform X2 [Balaenoptera acutorostrata]|nr:zinc finger protein 33B isoform X2 [Balaenoptera acutorostrata]XP_057385993.1 zinc finger protein 33B isoform X2 [Balaenoptera acutorostrata]XP_057385994.1 zinc finger protein 33B isoform X2 [Balaenoptera acutorostrata]